jgi:hypothetical protein
MSASQTIEHQMPRFLRLDSFARLEAKAREVMRERGYSEKMIEAELNRVERPEPKD